MLLFILTSLSVHAKNWMNYPEVFSCSTLDCSEPEAALALIERLVEAAYNIAEGKPNDNVDGLMLKIRIEQCSWAISSIQEDLDRYTKGVYISRSAMLDNFHATFAGQAVGCGMLVKVLNAVNER